MRRYWILFAQTVTIGLAIWFILATLQPNWANKILRKTHLPSFSAIQIQEAPFRAPAAQSSYRDAVKRATPSVVNIFTRKQTRSLKNPFLDDPLFKRFFGDKFAPQEQTQSSLGSGVVVSEDGYILTNNHVIEAANEIEVALADGRKAAAKVVGTDPDTDLAVIKIDLPNLPVMVFGRIDHARVGDVVLAIGNPFGVGQTVTMGIISALGRSHLGINTFENFIQTDAAINPGNSGGALVDAEGNLLGINSAIFSNSGGSLGIGFAIPVSTVKVVMESIIKHGQVIRGWIGVEPQDITSELAEGFSLNRKDGVMIAGVLRDGPADRVGVRPGDILLSINDKKIKDTTEMLNAVAQLTPGTQSKLSVLRRNQELSINIKIGQRPSR
jgi:serine protease DegQ